MEKKRIIIAASVVALLLIASWYTHGDLRRSVELTPYAYPADVKWEDAVVADNAPAGELMADETEYDDGISNAPESMGYFNEGFVVPERDGLMVHDSSIVPLEGGKMAASWYSGSREGAKDVSVYFSILSPEDGWSHPVPIVSRAIHMSERGRYAKKVGNAMLARDEAGRLWLFYCSIPFGGWSWSTLNYKYSDDDGTTWSKARPLVLAPLFNLTNNVKNKALAMRGGGFLLPTYHELIKKRSELVRLLPNGVYDKRLMTHSGRAIQPSLVPKGRGRLGAFYRNMSPRSKRSPRRVLYSESPDMGRTWGEMFETTLSNPNAGLDVISVSGQGGTLLGVLNNIQQGRHRLTLERSDDGGRTWQELRVLEDTEGMEFSYPFMARGSDGLFHITYTYDRKSIKHVSFDSLWLDFATDKARGLLYND